MRQNKHLTYKNWTPQKSTFFFGACSMDGCPENREGLPQNLGSNHGLKYTKVRRWLAQPKSTQGLSKWAKNLGLLFLFQSKLNVPYLLIGQDVIGRQHKSLAGWDFWLNTTHALLPIMLHTHPRGKHPIQIKISYSFFKVRPISVVV